MVMVAGPGTGHTTGVWREPDNRWSSSCDVRETLDEAEADSAVFRRFLDLRGRARDGVACVNGRFLFMNSAASAIFGAEHRDELWAWASDSLGRGDPERTVLSAAGRTLDATCVPIVTHGQVAGAEVRICGADAPTTRTPRVPFGWASLRDSELGIAQLVAEGLTNREVGARLFLSRHTIDFHLRQIYRKLAISSRVELTRLVLEHAHRADAIGPGSDSAFAS